MPDPIPLNAADLRVAMRDPRYWQRGHPEQAAYRAWVSEGWREVSAGEAAGDGLVWVAPCTRHRDGEAEEVSGHYRHTGQRAADASEATAHPVRASEQELPDGGRRITLRNADGSLVGSCESLADGSQVCTLGLPDGQVVVQEFAARDGEIVPVGGPLAVPLAGGALMTAAVSVYNYLLNMPRRPRGGADVADTPFLLLGRGFEGAEPDLRVAVGTLSPERVLEFCPKTPEFDDLVADVAAATSRDGLSAQQWGTAVHLQIRDAIDNRYGMNPNVSAEISLAGSTGTIRPYGERGTTRLDIFHVVEGTSTVCAYDVKTGASGLNNQQTARIYRAASAYAIRHGVATPHVLVIELRPPR